MPLGAIARDDICNVFLFKTKIATAYSALVATLISAIGLKVMIESDCQSAVTSFRDVTPPADWGLLSMYQSLAYVYNC